MNFAKSNGETIQEHTNKLLENLEILKQTYGKEIIKQEKIQIEEKRFWEILKIICTYHDIGKIFTPFQNLIREKMKLEKLPTEFNYESIKHEQLSPLFIPIEKLKLNVEEKKLVYQAIYYHHERQKDDVDSKLVEEIIKKDFYPRIEEIKKELEIEIEENLSSFYLTKVGSNKRIKDGDTYYREYCLLKGLLNRIDHSSSGNLIIEDSTKEKISDYTMQFMKEKKHQLYKLQEFARTNKDENILLIGSTGMGKTEAALLWSNNSKAFFTLPIRTSINAIYDRINENIGYEHVGLLHSTALDYLEEKQEIEMEDSIYEQSKNLCQKITTCTIDQLFPFIFKYKGYEKIYATLSYSKIIIDEIQAYSPEIVAILIKGLEMIFQMGGKFMVMTATLPRIYKEELEKRNIHFKFDQFTKPMQRHKIKIENKGILEDITIISKKAEKSKILIIANTVNRSIEIYEQLKKEGVKNIHLLHSRFTLKDRSSKEKQIIEFVSNQTENGIWITTQIVEASLDIDFDYLYTEMSTLDSLFQRLGRCYRSREYKAKEPNVWIYTKEASGIGSVYDKAISQKSIELLEKYDNKVLKEETKIDLVDKLYAEETLKGTEFYDKFRSGIEILDHIVDYNTNKSDAQKLLRNIESITIIPKIIYDENIQLFEKYKEAKKKKDCQEKNKIRRQINQLTISISKKQQWKIKENLIPNSDIKEILIADLKYNEEIGLLLEKDEEYELDKRFL